MKRKALPLLVLAVTALVAAGGANAQQPPDHAPELVGQAPGGPEPESQAPEGPREPPPPPSQAPTFDDQKSGAHEALLSQAPGRQEPNGNDQIRSVGRTWTTIEIFLSAAILLFGLIIFLLQTLLMFRLKLEWTPTAILRFNGLTLIISGGLILVVAGYSNQQIAPVMGLLGTIAGYLLGATEKPRPDPQTGDNG